MKRYFKEVRLLEKGKIDIKEFIRRATGVNEINDYRAAAAYLIYREDGGRKFKPEDFEKAVEKKESEYPLSELVKVDDPCL